jgi:hypothetical protein
MFVTDDMIAEVADDMQTAFHFVLHSQSSIREIADVAEGPCLIAACRHAGRWPSWSPRWR